MISAYADRLNIQLKELEYILEDSRAIWADSMRQEFDREFWNTFYLEVNSYLIALEKLREEIERETLNSSGIP